MDVDKASFVLREKKKETYNIQKWKMEILKTLRRRISREGGGRKPCAREVAIFYLTKEEERLRKEEGRGEEGRNSR